MGTLRRLFEAETLLSFAFMVGLTGCDRQSPTRDVVSGIKTPSSDNATVAPISKTLGDNQDSSSNATGSSISASVAPATFIVLRGDVNLDGKVNSADADALIASGLFNTDQAARWCQGDVTLDGVIDSLDSAELTSYLDAAETKMTILLGDTNLDGKVNSTDVTTMNGAGKYATGDAATWCDGDFTRDGKVDQSDIDAMQANFGKSL
jgi:hypothetical protein